MNITHSESQPPAMPLPGPETCPGAGAPLSDYITEPWEHHTQGSLGTNLQNNPYYTLAMGDEHNYTLCWMKKKGMKTYYYNAWKEENTTLGCPGFKNGNRVKKLVASMPDDQVLRGWELHTLEDMRWNYNYQRPIKYWNRDIINSMTWLMRQPS